MFSPEELTEIIVENGGTVNNIIDDKTTHLITSRRDAERGAPKVVEAAKYDAIEIVSAQWALHTVKSWNRFDESSYSLRHRISTSSETRKRAPIESLLDVDEPPKKKQKCQQELGHQVQVAVDEHCTLQGLSSPPGIPISERPIALRPLQKSDKPSSASLSDTVLSICWWSDADLEARLLGGMGRRKWPDLRRRSRTNRESGHAQ